MGEWNLPPHFVQIQNTNSVMDLAFFTPKITTSINPIFTTWDAHANQVQAPNARHTPPIPHQNPPQSHTQANPTN